jgi:Domain of unknown function (DUF7014)/AbiJ N-terminal domain 4
MTIFDLFSKRAKRARGEVPDVYRYDRVPNAFRVQVVHIWQDAIGSEEEYRNRYVQVGPLYKFLVDALCREYGVFALGEGRGGGRNYMEELINFFLKEEDDERVLDVIELSFRAIDRSTRNFDFRQQARYHEIANDAIYELNCRLKEHGLGFKYEDGFVIRVDSELLHAEAVKPALRLLQKKEYAGPQQEFLEAFEFYRHRKYKASLNEALKAFESTMKAICKKRGWEFDQNDSSRALIDICYSHGLIPAFWQGHMASIRALLEGGIPSVRNKLSGHGQGEAPTAVPDHIVAYTLHMAGAAIVFLVKSEENLK